MPPDYGAIGIAPWTQDNCTQAFLDAASSDNSFNVQAFIFYPENNDPTVPNMEDPYWEGINYKGLDFPIYAISGQGGIPIMHQVMQNSLNRTSYMNYSGYTRVYSQVNTGSLTESLAL
jgi:hypothetical protein